ncbi:STAS domain-containing protein [Streptomyces globosus]
MHDLHKHPSGGSARRYPLASVACRTGRGGVCVITLSGEFDLDSAPAVGRALDAVMRTSTVRHTIVDCTGVAFAGSDLLDVLLTARCRQEVVLAGPLPRALGVLLDLTGSAGLFTVADSLDAARRHLGDRSPAAPGSGR